MTPLGTIPRIPKTRPDRPEHIRTYIRFVDVPLQAAERDYMRRKLTAKLQKFSPFVERVSVRVDDVNGPRGGRDKSCRVKVVLRGLPSLFVSRQDRMVRPAFDGALDEMVRAVRKMIQRHRTRQSGYSV